VGQVGTKANGGGDVPDARLRLSHLGFSIRAMPGLNLSSASEGLPESCHRFGDALRFVLLWVLMFVIAPKAAAQALSAEARASLRRGEVALDQGDFAGAIVALERARELAPNRPEALRPLLLAYLQAGQIPKAVRVGREATAAWPEDAELHHWLGLAYFKTEQNRKPGKNSRNLKRSMVAILRLTSIWHWFS